MVPCVQSGGGARVSAAEGRRTCNEATARPRSPLPARTEACLVAVAPHPTPCREGDLVTIAGANDIQRAMQEAVEVASRGAGARAQLTQQSLPPIRMQVVQVASEVSGGTRGRMAAVPSSERQPRRWRARRRASFPPVPSNRRPCACTLQAEVPRIPENEMLYVQQMLAQLQKSQGAQKAAAAAPEEAAPPVQIDEWILQARREAEGGGAGEGRLGLVGAHTVACCADTNACESWDPCHPTTPPLHPPRVPPTNRRLLFFQPASLSTCSRSTAASTPTSRSSARRWGRTSWPPPSPR